MHKRDWRPGKPLKSVGKWVSLPYKVPRRVVGDVSWAMAWAMEVSLVVGDYVADRISPTRDVWETIQTDLGSPEHDLMDQSANTGGQV